MSEETGLPASFELAWGVRERPTKGPRRALSLEQVVAAGVAVAYAEGIGAVSMGRVAKELGMSAMGLYRYVGSKDELLALMVDQALGDVQEVAGDDGWRAGLERWAWASLAAYRRHNWVIQVPIAGPPITPRSIKFLEYGLRCMVDTPLTPSEKMSAIMSITSHVRAWASLSLQVTAAMTTDPSAARVLANYGKILAQLIDPAEFPEVQKIIESDAFDPTDEMDDDDFVFGLARLLDGIDVFIASRA
jgi:AcrR family transcriptional regulator